MTRTVAYGAVLVGIGLATGLWLGGWGKRERVEPAAGRLGVSASASAPRLGPADAGERRDVIGLKQQLNLLASKLAKETDERGRLEERLELLAADLAALRAGGGGAPTSESAAAASAPAPDTTVSSTADSGWVEPDLTAMERALVAAGIDAGSATEIKRRQDELALSEIYLRDVAAREGWLDTPEFNEEMAEIERHRTSIRDEIGDAAYDRYLAALEQPNRVAVDDVLLESPAAMAGLRAGDVVLRYDETRIFSPGELVAATRGGTPGEIVRIEITRQGQRFEVDVPRGPLGLRIAAAYGAPDES
jgi:hypothetical protein